MSHNAKNSFFLRLISISLFFAVFGLFSVDSGTTANAQAQKARPKVTTNAFSESTAAQQPIYSDYKGVRIGMVTDEVRAKLGQPSQVLDDQDFYVVSATETVQVFYDPAHKVRAISIDYVGDHGGAPGYKEIVGTDIQVKPDGSIYKMVRYDQLGFWVSFNRTAGDLAITTVTIQRFR